MSDLPRLSWPRVSMNACGASLAAAQLHAAHTQTGLRSSCICWSGVKAHYGPGPAAQLVLINTEAANEATAWDQSAAQQLAMVYDTRPPHSLGTTLDHHQETGSSQLRLPALPLC